MELFYLLRFGFRVLPLEWAQHSLSSPLQQQSPTTTKHIQECLCSHCSLSPTTEQSRMICCWQHQKMAVGSWWGCLIFWVIWDLLIIKHMNVPFLLFFWIINFITAITIPFLSYSSNFSLTSWLITPSGVIMENLVYSCMTCSYK